MKDENKVIIECPHSSLIFAINKEDFNHMLTKQKEKNEKERI